MTRILHAALVCAASLSMIACSDLQRSDVPQAEAQPEAAPATGNADHSAVLENVEAWAAEEFKRLAASEMIYRYVPVSFDEVDPVTLSTTTTYFKAYRELTG